MNNPIVEAANKKNKETSTAFAFRVLEEIFSNVKQYPNLEEVFQISDTGAIKIVGTEYLILIDGFNSKGDALFCLTDNEGIESYDVFGLASIGYAIRQIEIKKSI